MGSSMRSHFDFMSESLLSNAFSLTIFILCDEKIHVMLFIKMLCADYIQLLPAALFDVYFYDVHVCLLHGICDKAFL